MRLALTLLSLVGCAQARPSAQHERSLGDADVGGDVVSTVDGHPITVADVEAYLRAEGGTPRAALAALQRQELLALEAERLGYGARPEVRGIARRALVQTLLETIEREHPPSAIRDDELRRAYESAGARFVVPERRRGDHALVRVSDAENEREARRVASSILAELERDPDAWARLRETPRRDGFALLVEELPLVGRDGSLESGFEEVLFSGDEPGLRSELARTSYGWHVVWVREVQPRDVRAFDEVRDELVEEQTNLRRFEALVALLDTLRERLGVELEPRGLEAALRVEPAE